METEKVRENRCRRIARREGYVLRKSRARNWSYHNQLGYIIIDARFNIVVRGGSFELDLDDVEELFEHAEEGAKH